MPALPSQAGRRRRARRWRVGLAVGDGGGDHAVADARSAAEVLVAGHAVGLAGQGRLRVERAGGGAGLGDVAAAAGLGGDGPPLLAGDGAGEHGPALLLPFVRAAGPGRPTSTTARRGAWTTPAPPTGRRRRGAGRSRRPAGPTPVPPSSRRPRRGRDGEEPGVPQRVEVGPLEVARAWRSLRCSRHCEAISRTAPSTSPMATPTSRRVRLSVPSHQGSERSGAPSPRSGASERHDGTHVPPTPGSGLEQPARGRCCPVPQPARRRGAAGNAASGATPARSARAGRRGPRRALPPPATPAGHRRCPRGRCRCRRDRALGQVPSLPPTPGVVRETVSGTGPGPRC
jgi:hypothetical protein